MGGKHKRKAQEAAPATPAPKKQQKETKASTTNAPASKAAPAPFVEDPRGAELKREVGLYEQLSSQDVAERLEAADAVVSGLLGGEGVSEQVLRRHLERRLFRGLASGRKAARLGFSLVLTEVLARLLGGDRVVGARYAELTFDTVLEILKAKTKPNGDLSGQEERDHAFGLLFGLQCFVRARVLFVEGGGERWEKVFEDLVRLAKKKPWMREECGWVIVEVLEQMGQQQAEGTLEELQEAGLAASPEGLGVWLTARRLFPDMKFPSKPWGHKGNPLDHLTALAKVLKESSSNADKKTGEAVPQTGNWHPQLHFAWDIVLHECIEGIKAGTRDTSAHFENFWKVVIDESLLSSSASAERKFWGFLLFQKALKEAAHCPLILNDLFSQNLMRCLINHVSHEDRFLHRAADKCMKSLLQAAEEDPNIVTTILPRLISHSGFFNFDQVTKTKTVARLLSQIRGDRACTLVIDQLISPVKVIKTADSVRDAELYRQILGDYILLMIRRINTADKTNDNTWVETHALPNLASLAYSNNETFTPPISEKTRVVFRNRLSSALAHLISNTSGFSSPCELLQNFEPSAVDMDKDILIAKDKALVVMNKLMRKSRKAREDEQKPLQALAMLYALVIFQLYNGESDAISLLDELRLCYDKLICEKDTTGSESSATIVLVEILLSLMSKQSVLLRKVAQQVFVAFAGEISEEGLELLVDVLESSESLKGQEQLFDQDDDELDHDDEDDELDSDVEILDANGLGESIESSGTEDDRESDDGEDDGQDDAEAQRLDDALAKALGTHRADQDLEEESSDGDAVMSDSEMMAVDSKLVEIFSQRKKQPNKKQEKKDARDNMINFKSRVLDLLEIFVKEQTTSPLAFDLLLPLLKLIRTTTAKQLSEKAHKVIIAFAKASKGLKSSEKPMPFDRPGRLHLLKAIHEEASRDLSHAFAKAASTASLLLSTTLYRASKTDIEGIARVYYDTQLRWLRGEAKMQTSFFQEWLNWCQSRVSLS